MGLNISIPGGGWLLKPARWGGILLFAWSAHELDVIRQVSAAVEQHDAALVAAVVNQRAVDHAAAGKAVTAAQVSASARSVIVLKTRKDIENAENSNCPSIPVAIDAALDGLPSANAYPSAP